MSIIGNVVGGGSPIKTLIIQDKDGNEFTGVVTDKLTVFDATPNDVREGKTFASDEGVKVGEKIIPAYHTTEAARYIPNGSEFTIPLSGLDKYNYTKLQVIICAFNTTLDNSVSAEKVVILDKVYDVGSTTEIASVTKDSSNKQINLGITNNSGHPCVIRIFTYKEID